MRYLIWLIWVGWSIPLIFCVIEIINCNTNPLGYFFILGILSAAFLHTYWATYESEYLTKRTKIRHRFVHADNKFNPQYRWFGIWRNIMRSSLDDEYYVKFNTIEESQKYVDEIIRRCTTKKIPDSYHYN